MFALLHLRTYTRFPARKIRESLRLSPFNTQGSIWLHKRARAFFFLLFFGAKLARGLTGAPTFRRDLLINSRSSRSPPSTWRPHGRARFILSAITSRYQHKTVGIDSTSRALADNERVSQFSDVKFRPIIEGHRNENARNSARPRTIFRDY